MLETFKINFSEKYEGHLQKMEERERQNKKKKERNYVINSLSFVYLWLN
jgi:hypothetical protein